MRHLKDNFTRFKIPLSLLLFSITGWFIFTFRILDVPPGINGDEASIGYNAALVARTGYDSNGKFLPLFTKVYDSNDWKQPVTFYATSLAFKLFQPSYFILRAVSVVFVLVGGILTFFLIKQLTDFKTAIWGLMIYIVTPIVMIQSHLALENIAPIPFVALWGWMLIKYGKRLEVKYLILASLALGFGLYSYLGMRLIVPVLFLLTLLYTYYLNRKTKFAKIRNILVIAIITITPFFVILLSIRSNYPGAIVGLYRSYNITSYQQPILSYISSFDLSFLYINGDVTPYHSTGKHGIFLLASLPLFVLGIIRTIQKRDSMLIFILISFFLTPLLFGLGSDVHRGSRLLSLVPFYAVISSLGLMSILNLKNQYGKLFLSSLIVFMMAINYIDFLNDYWYKYPERVKADFAKPIHLAFERLYNESKYNNLNPLIQTDFTQQNIIAFNFFEQVYFPNKLPTWTVGQDIPKSSVILVNNPTLQNLKNLKIINIEKTEWFLIVNSSKN